MRRLLCLSLLAGLGTAGGAAEKTWNLDEIRIRDPFVVVDRAASTYYLYAQMGNRLNNPSHQKGVEVYTSKDLKTWRGPKPVFVVPDDFWAPEMVWAPEVHAYQGRYYLFVTFSGKKLRPQEGRPDLQVRGSQVLVADSPEGPFQPFANGPHTPRDWMALDGTLWTEDGVPWMIFCHEWVQIEDGTMELVRLADDLSKPVGDPVTLFKATEAPWVRSLTDTGGRHHGYVTDGAFLYRTKGGKLLMIWSSFGDQNYAVGLAVSESGKVRGPWKQLPEPLFQKDGGHGMIFRTLDDKLMLVLHQPNSGRLERARFFELEDTGTSLRLEQ
ncbi:MAG: family 43 glycosylhydrolase [bacterium]|nr:family 43 glycosylhydrolase [bacterium]